VKTAILVTALAIMPSCYRYSVAGNGVTEVQSTRVVVAWGIFDDETPIPPPPSRAAFCQAHPNDFACEKCPSGIRDVQISSNFLYALATVATLGFVNLVDIKYRCAAQTGSSPFPLPG
jgi:hypothetical protein